MVHNRQSKHGYTHTEPTDLRDGEYGRGNVGAFAAECVVGEQVYAQLSARCGVGQQTRVNAEEEITDQKGDNEFLQSKARTHGCTGKHTGAKEGEAHHDDKHRPEAASVFCRDALLFKVAALLLLFFHKRF